MELEKKASLQYGAGENPNPKNPLLPGSPLVSITASYLDREIPVSVRILDGDGKEIADFSLRGSASVSIDDPHLWSSEDPYLYTIVFETSREVIADRIGIREVRVDGNVLKINGQPSNSAA